MNNEMPAVGHSTYSAQAANLGQQNLYLNQQQNPFNQALEQNLNQRAAALLRSKPKEPDMATRRFVKVLIVDPDPNVPLDDCLLYCGDEKMTDATDQELFFEIDILQILEAHNARRTKVIDKKVKGRTEYLEPARIRDLRMQIVEVAKF
jgi:hypothetical protein